MLCDYLEGWDGVGNGRGLRREGTYVYLWLILVNVRQRPAQNCKAIILQLKAKKGGQFKRPLKEKKMKKEKEKQTELKCLFNDNVFHLSATGELDKH